DPATGRESIRTDSGANPASRFYKEHQRRGGQVDSHLFSAGALRRRSILPKFQQLHKIERDQLAERRSRHVNCSKIDGRPEDRFPQGLAVFPLAPLEISKMLVLSRKLGEKIVIGDNIVVTVVKIDRNQIRIGIEAPHDVQVYREEIAPQRTGKASLQ